MWARTDYFVGGTVHPVADYSGTEGLLLREMEDMLGRYAARIVGKLSHELGGALQDFVHNLVLDPQFLGPFE